jgi:cytochrome o ubiquinol oxidase subunit 2
MWVLSLALATGSGAVAKGFHRIGPRYQLSSSDGMTVAAAYMGMIGKVFNLARTSGRRGLLVVALLLTSGCAHGILDPRGPVGESERQILYDATALMLMVVVPVILGILSIAWWFRSTNPHARRKLQWDYSGRIEFVTWSIPALLVLFLGGIAWISSHDLDPPKPLAAAAAPVEIQVISLDWKWLFIYPKERVAAVNQVVIPVNVPLRFKLSSASVMNSFFIPQLGSQIYTMAGMTTELNLLASEPGTYNGISAQFSGDGFSDMHFEVLAVSKEEYQRWLAASREAATPLDMAHYRALSRPSIAEATRVYGDVAADLFESVVEHHGAPPIQAARVDGDHCGGKACSAN